MVENLINPDVEIDQKLIYQYVFNYDRFVESEHYTNCSPKHREFAYHEDGFVYIGSTKIPHKRYNQHKLSGKKPRTKWASRIKRYGFENFDYEILELCDGTYSDLLETEQKWLDEVNPFDFGYNTARSTKLSLEDIQSLKNKRTIPIAVVRESDGILVKIYKSLSDASIKEDVNYEQLVYTAKKNIPYSIKATTHGYIFVRLCHIVSENLMLGSYVDLTGIVNITSKVKTKKYIFVDKSNTPRIIVGGEETAMAIIGVTTKREFGLFINLGKSHNGLKIYGENPNIKYKLGYPINYDPDNQGIDYSKMYLVYKNKLLIDQLQFKHSVTNKYPDLTRYILNKMILNKTEHNKYFVKSMLDVKDTPIIGYSKLAIDTTIKEVLRNE